MAVTREDWSALFTGATNSPQELYQNAVRLHRKWYLALTLSTVALLVTYVMLSYKGNFAWIAVINAGLVLVLGLYVSMPATFLTLFGGGAGAKLASYNWEWRNLFEDQKKVFPDIQISEIAKKGWETYVAALKLPAHYLMLMIAAGGILEFHRIEKPGYAIPVFTFLFAIGLWSFVYAIKANWYRNISLSIFVIGSLGSLIVAFIYTPAQDEILTEVQRLQRLNEDNQKNATMKQLRQKVERGGILTAAEERFLNQAARAKEARGPIGSVTNLWYSDTLELEAASFSPQELCGVRPGERTFEIPQTVYVLIGGTTNYDLTSFIRVNGVLPGKKFLVGDDGCVRVSFAVNGNTQFAPQFIRIKFS